MSYTGNILPGGLWPVMLTPFRENGAIDFPALEQLSDFYLESGAGGLFANCLSSEMFQLEPGERIDITRTVVRRVAGKVPVVSTGNFGDDIAKNRDFMFRLRDLGVDAVVVNSNQLCDEHEGDDIFLARLEKLLACTGDLSLGIYECPVPHKRLLSDRVFSWIVSTGRFSYFKDTSCDTGIIRERQKVSSGSILRLFNANTPTAYASLLDGVAGLSPIGANFFPELYHYLYEHIREGCSESLAGLRAFLSAADPVVHAVYPYSAKMFLQLRGLPIRSHTRQAANTLSREELLRLQELFVKMSEMLKSLGIENKSLGDKL